MNATMLRIPVGRFAKSADFGGIAIYRMNSASATSIPATVSSSMAVAPSS